MFNKKKVTFLAVSLLGMATTLAGCGREGESVGSVDETKTQLYVKYFNGGLRRAWIDKVCDDFEADYADYSFEPGKKGIQIRKDFEKNAIQVDAITKSSYQVFVMENVDYFQFVSKKTMLDITDVVKGNAPINASEKETKTIESKFYSDSKSFYNVGDSKGAKYYGIPFYDSACSINYNIDLFEEKGFYFKKGKSADSFSESELNSYGKVSELFVTDLSDEKSLGPNGRTGIIDGVDYSYDDGLPATYADFHALLTYMAAENVSPIAWNGYEKGYLTSLALSAWNNAIGYREAKNALTFSGTSTKILDLDSSYRPKKDNDGNYIYADDLSVNASNVYKTHQQKGLLDACNFVKIIMSNKDYRYGESDSPNFMHTTAQNYFINGTPNNGKPIGMLIEGAWWNSEATDSYKSNEKMTKRFGIMPMPKPSTEQIGEENVTLSDRDSSMFINANCPENMLEAAKTFLAYLNSDRAMNTFSEYTDMMRMMNYDLTEDTLSKMSYYGKEAYKFYHAPDTRHLDWRPLTEEASLKTSALSYRKWGFSTSASSENPFEYFRSNQNDSGEDLFANINRYFDLSWAK